MQLEDWLTAHHLDDCAPIFRENRIDLDVIALLTEDDLKEMGLPVGMRRRFFAAVQTASVEIPGQVEAPREGAHPPEQPTANVSAPQEIPLPPEPTHSPETAPLLEIPPPPESSHPLEAAPSLDSSRPGLAIQPPPPRPVLEQVTEEPSASRNGRYGRKATAIAGALAVHAVLLLIAALVVFLPKPKDPPTIVARITPPKPPSQEMRKKAVQKQLKRTPSAASATAAPMAQLMRANAVARISLPEVTRTSTGPLGLGDSDLGNGAFGSGSGMSGNAADGMTMFGGAGGSGLPGTFYDMKQGQDRKPNGSFEENSYRAELRAFADSRFNSLEVSKFYRAPRKLALASLLVNEVSADEGPKAFQVEDEVNPMFWFVHYSGRVSPPESGKWRFAGGFDNVLYIYVNHELVFDGGYRHPESDVGRYFPQGGFCIGTPVRYGKWVDLNRPFQLDIILGESGGSLMGGAILIEREGESYKKLPDGTPILPLFAIDQKPRGDILKRMKIYPKPGATPYPFADASSSPVFHSL